MKVKEIALTIASFIVSVLILLIMIYAISNGSLERVRDIDKNKVVNKYIGEN